MKTATKDRRGTHERAASDSTRTGNWFTLRHIVDPDVDPDCALPETFGRGFDDYEPQRREIW